MKYLCYRVILGALVALLVGVIPARAGGPLLIFDPVTRTAFAYVPATFGGSVPVYTDLGPMGPLSNEQADALAALGFAEWSGVATSIFSATVAGDLASVGLPDIDGTNAGLVIGTFNGGGIHVIYDHDQSILFDFFGAPPGVLGIASPDFAVTGTPEISESWVVLNGAAVDPADLAPFPGASFAGVFTHEFGHALNLAHTQTNGAVLFFGDATGPQTCAPPYAGSPTFADQETMYPFIDPSPGSIGIDMASVDRPDDIAALSDLYPAAGWPERFGTITGTIYLSDAATEVTGVNVIARNLADPFGDAVSALSGNYTQGLLGPDGLYTFNGLTPGANYAVYVDGIVQGGFSTPPAVPLPGPEEFYNGNAESGDEEADDVCDVTPITAVAGAPVTADVIFNFAINLGDDDFVLAALPFTFPYCGHAYDAVYINSNGSLSFGEGDPSFFGTVDGLLTGPPRIAALWDDLNPTGGGTVTAEAGDGTFVVTFEGVPEFPNVGSNTFSITLRPDGSFSVDYGGLDAADGLAGRSTGFTLDPGETDLTAAPQPLTSPAPGVAIYELFDANDNDLDGESLAYAPCRAPELAGATSGACYGATGAAGDGVLLTVDTFTGAGTVIGSTGLGGVPGLAINAAGEIFGTQRATGRIYQLDAATGAAFFVMDPGLAFLDAIAFDADDTLYGIDVTNTLYTIDLDAGTVTPVGNTGVTPAPYLAGMAFDPADGTLYASTGGLGGADAIYGVDPTTAEATLIGNTGLGDGAIPDLQIDAAGTLYASKNTGDGTFELITVDKATGAGTVLGPFGVPNVSGLACAPGLPVHHFVLLADREITIDRHAASEGRIHSNDDVDFRRGAPSTHTGDVSAVGDIKIGCGNTIDGDVTAGDDLDVAGRRHEEDDEDGWYAGEDRYGYPRSIFDVLDKLRHFKRDRCSATITGTATESAAVDPVPLPDPDFDAGGRDVRLRKGQTLALEPGSYGRVRIEKEARLALTAGAYFFEDLDVKKEATLAVDVSGGAVTVNVEDDMRLDRETAVVLSPDHPAAGIRLTFNVLEDIRIGRESVIRGTLIAPEGDVRLEREVFFRGSIAAEEIDVERGVVFVPHGSATTTMPRITVPSELLAAEEALEVAPETPAEFALEANYPNPFNPTTTIAFALPESREVRLEVFDMLGRRVDVLVSGVMPAGRHEVRWQAGNRASGMYVYRIIAGDFVEVRRMVLLK